MTWRRPTDPVSALCWRPDCWTRSARRARRPVLTTPQSLEQTYRLCIALEPAALLEPGYDLAPELIASCRLAGERAAERLQAHLQHTIENLARFGPLLSRP